MRRSGVLFLPLWRQAPAARIDGSLRAQAAEWHVLLRQSFRRENIYQFRQSRCDGAVHAYSAGITATGDWHRAVELLNDLQNISQANVVTFSSAISGCEKISAWQPVLLLLRQAQDAFVEADVIVFNAVASACQKGSDWQRAAQLLDVLFREALEPTIVSHSTVISAWGRASRWQVALYLLRALPLFGLQANRVAYGAMLSACEASSHWQTALGLFAEVGSKSLKVNLIIANTVISACEKAAEWEAALVLLSNLLALQMPQLPQPDEISFNSAISACEKAGQWQWALKLLEELEPCAALQSQLKSAEQTCSDPAGHLLAQVRSESTQAKRLTKEPECLQLESSFFWRATKSLRLDYTRRVRLAFERTPRRKRHVLAPEMVSQLHGRAWWTTQDIDHAQLIRRNGAIYLLSCLRECLGRLPVPDIGVRLEALMLKLRRSPGQTMATWASNRRQQYRLLQVALSRVRGSSSGVKTPANAVSSPSRSGPSTTSSPRRRASGTMEDEPHAEAVEEDEETETVKPEDEEDEEEELGRDGSPR
eukprot:s7495_g1.t1